MQPDRHPTLDSRSAHPVPSKPIPPPLSLLPPSTNQNHSSELEDNMTARCSQFPPDLLDARPSLDLVSASFPSYLTNVNTDPSPWPDNASSSSSLAGQSFRLDSPRSSTTADLSSSSSSAAASISNPPFIPPVSNPESLSKFDASSPPPPPDSGFFSSLGHAPSYDSAYHHAFPHQDYQHHHHVPLQPRHSLPLQYSGPPPTAFTPSTGSPPLLPPHVFTPDPGSRRHTVSAFLPPSALEIGLLGRHDLEDTILKEEKRRRNKESSQRFRDRTRERQREKQERLEYLERRIKDLEIQLKQARASGGQPSGNVELSQPPPMGRLVGENETALSAMQRLQRENESLRAALKTAEQEVGCHTYPLPGSEMLMVLAPVQIHRLRPGPSMTQLPTAHSAFSVGQVFSSLPQLSPPASGTWSEASSSPSAHEREQPTYFTTCTRTSSPASDSCPPPPPHAHQQHQSRWEPQEPGSSGSTGLVNWPLEPQQHHPMSPAQQAQAQQVDQFNSTL
ncbi:hypothetical protein CROQUDRAFT_92328 [Cronartium quercuum f. sp. fusiforme G11]|uniref:BZIP domain-containing protein n=1 Tax=Cronartium quercuum f. sp. fusiforme G11 TaxID=708437 RepID=A0A9P6NND0_9BASI|nr:hypothetical protein CROQUDRAFT_92328 [Cronartium quercuum f. sp. fusiforme G11]